MEQPDLAADMKILHRFLDEGMGLRMASIERDIPRLATNEGLANYLMLNSLDPKTLRSALRVKRAVGQINVLVHAVGMLVALPQILENGERIEAISLGAGNTGRTFDLQTDRRVAEFKFIDWKGGAEAIRQNSVFKDFLGLLWDTSGRMRQLYVNGLEEPTRFLMGNRAISSVLSRNVKLTAQFRSRYGDRYSRVGEFYADFGKHVEIIDLTTILPDVGA